MPIMASVTSPGPEATSAGVSGAGGDAGVLAGGLGVLAGLLAGFVVSGLVAGSGLAGFFASDCFRPASDLSLSAKDFWVTAGLSGAL